MFSFKIKKDKKNEVKVLNFQDVEDALNKGAFKIKTSEVKYDIYKTPKEIFLSSNKKISMLLNYFLKLKGIDYSNNYLSAIQKLNNSTLHKSFENITKAADKSILDKIIIQVENEFNEFWKEFVELRKTRIEIINQIELEFNNLYPKVEKILTELELEIEKLMPSKELRDEWSKAGLSYTFSSSKQYRKLQVHLQEKPKQLAFISEIIHQSLNK